MYYKLPTLDDETIKVLNMINGSVTIEIPNTKGISSEMISKLNNSVSIRVAGAYDDKRVILRKDAVYKDGETGAYYRDAVIYSRNELHGILKSFERYEESINDEMDDLEKYVHLYDTLKADIMYDPKFESKSSHDIRSLRGVLSKQTVCAGYSLIFKELCDRNNLPCEYVEGNTGSKDSGHAWNIITYNNKKIGLDLTWDSSTYMKGSFKSHDYFGQNVEEFARRHIPDSNEQIQNYSSTLSSVNKNELNYIRNTQAAIKDYNRTICHLRHKDTNNRYLVGQVGNQVINNTEFFRYIYSEEVNREYSMPIVFYSETNLIKMINVYRRDKDKVPKEYVEKLLGELFSKDNIKKMLSNNTQYIGKINKEEDGHFSISTNKEKEEYFNFPTKYVTRSDGSKFIIQKMSKDPRKIGNNELYNYHMFSIVDIDGKHNLRRNIVQGDRDIFLDNRQEVFDTLLNQENVSRRCKYIRGYIGHLDNKGEIIDNPDVIEYFNNTKYSNIKKRQNNKKDNSISKLPSFDEVKELTDKYEITISLNNPDKIEIVDIESRRVVSDENLKNKAMFANIWLSAAGVKYMTNDKRPGDTYAFNDSTREIYNSVCEKMTNDCKNTGNINTLNTFEYIDTNFNYKYKEDIVIGLFRTPFQAEFINNIVRKSTGMENSNLKTPDALYSLNYTGGLIGNKNRRMSVNSQLNDMFDDNIVVSNDNEKGVTR